MDIVPRPWCHGDTFLARGLFERHRRGKSSMRARKIVTSRVLKNISSFQVQPLDMIYIYIHICMYTLVTIRGFCGSRVTVGSDEGSTCDLQSKLERTFFLKDVSLSVTQTYIFSSLRCDAIL